MTRVRAGSRTSVEWVLGAAGATLLALAVERLLNAVMLWGSAGARVALIFSVALGVTGALLLGVVFIRRYLRGTSRRFGDRGPSRQSKARPEK